ncbi:tyrosine phosphatase family-domain-containing protein, partial [Cladochytrium replicatum]
VEGVLNFRDFGGYPVRDGRIVRWEHLYRSGKLNAITERGKRQLLALGVSRTIDLRNAGEAEREPTPAIDLVERAHCPVFAGQIPPEEVARRWKLYTEGGDPGFAEAYMIICESATSSYAQYLRHILLTKEPIVVHCTAGKDRTGVFAALLLKFLEVDEDLIVRDYSLTESMLFWSDQELRDLVEASKGLINMEGVKDLLASRPGALRLFFMKFAETYGTVQQYYEVALGLSKTELAELKDFLVLQPPFSYPPFQNLVTRY